MTSINYLTKILWHDYLNSLKKNKDGYFYFVQAEDGGLIKIEYAKRIHQRLNIIQSTSPVKMNTLIIIEGSNDLEKHLHLLFNKFRKHGEWFEPSEELLSFIRFIQCLEVDPDEIDSQKVIAELQKEGRM